MIKIWLVVLFSLLFVFFGGLPRYISFEATEYINLTLGSSAVLNLEVATTPIEWQTGLSNRKKLCDNCGMIFVFPNPEIKNFVMREMLFPLDIIWLNQSRVIGYSENLQPEKSPYTSHFSPSPTDLVIEVPAGFVHNNSIAIGDSLQYDD